MEVMSGPLVVRFRVELANDEDGNVDEDVRLMSVDAAVELF